jgi:hypothetical protein
MPVVGSLSGSSPVAAEEIYTAIRQGLKDGYTEEQNASLEYRWSEGLPSQVHLQHQEKAA